MYTVLRNRDEAHGVHKILPPNTNPLLFFARPRGCFTPQTYRRSVGLLVRRCMSRRGAHTDAHRHSTPCSAMFPARQPEADSRVVCPICLSTVANPTVRKLQRTNTSHTAYTKQYVKLHGIGKPVCALVVRPLAEWRTDPSTSRSWVTSAVCTIVPPGGMAWTLAIGREPPGTLTSLPEPEWEP